MKTCSVMSDKMARGAPLIAVHWTDRDSIAFAGNTEPELAGFPLDAVRSSRPACSFKSMVNSPVDAPGQVPSHRPATTNGTLTQGKRRIASNYSEYDKTGRRTR